MSPKLFGLMTQLLRRPSLMPSCQFNARCTLLVLKCKLHEITSWPCCISTLRPQNLLATRPVPAQHVQHVALAFHIQTWTHEATKWEHMRQGDPRLANMSGLPHKQSLDQTWVQDSKTETPPKIQHKPFWDCYSSLVVPNHCIIA